MRAARPAVLLLCLALSASAVTIVLDDPALPAMALWFLAVVVVHDGVLLPLYSGADRALVRVAARRPAGVPLVNHVRVPALGAGLTLLVFLPGILGRGADAHLAATGLDQRPYPLRWLLLVAAMAAASAAVYAVRVLRARRRGRSRMDRSAPPGPP